MDQKVIALLLLIAGISLWKGMTWLAGISLAVLVLILLGEPRPKPVPAGGTEKEEEEILTPVIVTDEGPPPWLYPPDFRIKIHPEWHAWSYFENAAASIASMMNLGSIALTGKEFPGYKYEDIRWGMRSQLERRAERRGEKKSKSGD